MPPAPASTLGTADGIHRKRRRAAGRPLQRPGHGERPELSLRTSTCGATSARSWRSMARRSTSDITGRTSSSSLQPEHYRPEQHLRGRPWFPEPLLLRGGPHRGVAQPRGSQLHHRPDRPPLDEHDRAENGRAAATYVGADAGSTLVLNGQIFGTLNKPRAPRPITALSTRWAPARCRPRARRPTPSPATTSCSTAPWN